jgi:uncharacterized protein YidB (DUF937 family)
MGLLDILKQFGGGAQAGQAGGLGSLAEIIMKNPQIVSAAISMLNPRDTSVGGSGGLGQIIDTFNKSGLGNVMSQWISTGPNPPISGDPLTQVLGSDVIGQVAQKAGLGQAEAGSALASVLPSLIDHLTPNGQVPDANALQNALGGLLSNLGR